MTQRELNRLISEMNRKSPYADDIREFYKKAAEAILKPKKRKP